MGMQEQPEHQEWSIAAHGDRCLVIRFGTGLDAAIGRRCGAAAAALRQAAISGVSDIVPTFNTVAVHYLPGRHSANSSLRSLEHKIREVLRDAPLDGTQASGRLVELPVCYGGDFGPDLPEVARRMGTSEDEVIQRHSGELLYVFMLGFAPGAPFMGVLDPGFALARRDTPRTAIPAGSVAVANRQTIVYPNESPGGWHIIGRSPVRLFDPMHEPATLIAPGDNVRFVPITPHTFQDWPTP